jgi:hypothetical protein
MTRFCAAMSLLPVPMFLAALTLPARSDVLSHPAAISARIDDCLRTTDFAHSCIGQETLRCMAEDQGAANPIQQMAWCAGAEQLAWEERMTSDIAAITQLLREGPLLRDFMSQQRMWQAYARDAFPYDRIDSTFPWGFRGQSGVMPIIASRALQVDEIRTAIEECFAKESDIRPQSLCDELTQEP